MVDIDFRFIFQSNLLPIMKSFFLLSVAVLSIFCLFSCRGESPAPSVGSSEGGASFKLSESSVSLHTTESSVLYVEALGVDGVLPEVEWWSSDSSIVSVDSDGSLLGVSVGVAEVWAVSVGGVDSVFCSVSVSSSVFVCGSVSGSGMQSGVVYRNGVECFVVDSVSVDVYFNAVGVCDGEVYVGGSLYDDSGYSSHIWRGSELLYSLPVGSVVSSVVPMYYDGVLGVYSAGYVYSGGVSTATVWDGSTPRTLRSGSSSGSSAVNGMCVDISNNLHCVGYVTDGGGYKVAMSWVSDSEVSLTDVSVDSEGVAVCVDAVGNVYIAGYVGDSAVLWCNGVVDTLSSGGLQSYATGVTVGGDGVVYISGFTTSADGVQTPVLWSGGVMSELSSMAGTANGVAVADDEVYVVGQVDGTNYLDAVVWRNGTIQQLTQQTSNSNATAVVVY